MSNWISMNKPIIELSISINVFCTGPTKAYSSHKIHHILIPQAALHCIPAFVTTHNSFATWCIVLESMILMPQSLGIISSLFSHLEVSEYAEASSWQIEIGQPQPPQVPWPIEREHSHTFTYYMFAAFGNCTCFPEHDVPKVFNSPGESQKLLEIFGDGDCHGSFAPSYRSYRCVPRPHSYTWCPSKALVGTCHCLGSQLTSPKPKDETRNSFTR